MFFVADSTSFKRIRPSIDTNGNSTGYIQGVYVYVCCLYEPHLFGQDVPESLWKAATSNVMLHLYKLSKENQASMFMCVCVCVKFNDGVAIYGMSVY